MAFQSKGRAQASVQERNSLDDGSPGRMSDLRADIVAAVPSLRAFAFSLARRQEDADDLVQDTLVRAFGRLGSFEPGTNLNAWLFTILRNTFYSAYRKRSREVEDPDGSYAARLSCHGEQEGHLQFADFLKAFDRLNPEQREALTLVVASGLQFDEAAAVMGVAVGTAKSRVIRARARLAQLLAIEGVEDVGPGRQELAALQA